MSDVTTPKLCQWRAKGNRAKRHPMTEENTYWWINANGYRVARCRTCRRRNTRASHERYLWRKPKASEWRRKNPEKARAQYLRWRNERDGKTKNAIAKALWVARNHKQYLEYGREYYWLKAKLVRARKAGVL